ncbi:Dynein regulatory complex protein 1 [Trichoplax sp. H2]|nr:Dynein regulatory complex protein 1 [Trichoplax sp. H2]|eukprot:RDD44726.1 Dynein regulatory complex protein 1 [Trichoplax sp. H2]
MDAPRSPIEEKEFEGPSVDSADLQERIAARRLRIKARVEAAKREAAEDDSKKKKSLDSSKEQTVSRKQVEQSRLRLAKLISDGSELVSNVKIAADSRTMTHVNEEDNKIRAKREKLEAEAKSASERFEEINGMWEVALAKKIPQELNIMLEEQRSACDAMVEEKDKLISEFQQELKVKDDLYIKDLRKQAEDIDLMITRMEEQIKNLTKAYGEELLQIEKSFVAERGDIMNAHTKNWEQLMTQRRDKEVEYMKAREKRVEDYEQQLQHLRVEDAEEYNMVKIKLETDVQVLEQQLQAMRATYQLNQEKLEYNFQVLKKRDEENTVTKSQQKRKITRLQDVLNNLRIKQSKQEKSFREENAQLTEDYKRLTEQFRELQRKSRHFQAIDAKKFREVWMMNEEKAKDLVKQVLDIDHAITEQQLGSEWMHPKVDFAIRGPVDTEEEYQGVSAAEFLAKAIAVENSDGRSTAQTEQNIDDKEVDITSEGKYSTHSGTQSNAPKRLSVKTIKRILEVLCDEAGFLVESKLKKLLAPLDKDERSLMQLDAIFNALGIDSENDIRKLADFFILESGDQLTTENVNRESPDEESEPRDQENETAQSDTNEDHSGELDKRKQSEIKLIHPNEVIKILRTFMEERRKPMKDQLKRHLFKLGTMPVRDASKDEEFWNYLAHIIPRERELQWNALQSGLEKYCEVLKSRETLLNDVDSLQVQNGELKGLLQQYMSSKVNQELEIPPTRVMQIDMAGELAS